MSFESYIACEQQTYFRSSLLFGGREATTGNASAVRRLKEHSDVESIGYRARICETELGSDEDEEDIYHWDPEGSYIDEPIAEEEWLTKYNRELEENERRNQESRFDRIRLNPRRFRSISHLWIISLKNLIIRYRRLRVVPIVERGDFYARLRFPRSTIPEEKWGLLVV